MDVVAQEFTRPNAGVTILPSDGHGHYTEHSRVDVESALD